MEVLFEFVEACAESAELFEVCEGSFDAIALAVKSTVEVALHLAQAARRDDGLDFVPGEMVEDGVGVIAFVGDHCLRPQFAEQWQGLGAVVGLAASQ